VSDEVPRTLISLWTPDRAREEARQRARDLLSGAYRDPLADVPESFQPLGSAGLESVLEALAAFDYVGPAEGAEALVLAASLLLRTHLAYFERGVATLIGLLERAPDAEGPWQPLLSALGQVLGDHLAEQVVWLQKQGSLDPDERTARLEHLQTSLEAALDKASAPGRAGLIVGLHQLVQYAHQQRNMTLLSDLATGDPDDLVRGVARQALIRAMDANFDLVY
jgi:hypothetical protein